MESQNDKNGPTVVLEDAKGETINPSRAELEKWKKAVIHLECATDSKTLDEQSEIWTRLSRKLEKGEVTPEKAAEAMRIGSRDIRHHGTAIFLKDNSRRYLVTARHVLYDEVGAANRLKYMRKRHGNSQLGPYIEMLRQNIYPIIFQVPSLDTFLKKDLTHPRKVLMNLGAGGSDTYIFSQDVDLAIVSLDQRNSDFADMLITDGYNPIRPEDVGEQPSSEGACVFSVGYPGPISTITEQELASGLQPWASSRISIPTFVFGHVAMLNDFNFDFWCDFTNYQGNSGAPVVEGNRLVGVVSSQPSYEAPVLKKGKGELKNTNFISKIRIPFAFVVKAKFIKELLKIQAEKDKRILSECPRPT